MDFSNEVTLITTTRDRPYFLLNCAKSIANQVTPPAEWLVYIDDDFYNYKNVVEQIESIVPYVNVFSKDKKIGRVSSLQYAHSKVKTKYVGWVDDDDWLDRECLAMCANYPYSDFIYTDFFEVRFNSVKIGERNKITFSHKKMLTDNIVFHFRLFTQALFESCGGLDLSYSTTMDYELTLRLLANITPQKINVPLYYYRIHKRRISARYHEQQKINFVRAVNKNRRIYDKYLSE